MYFKNKGNVHSSISDHGEHLELGFMIDRVTVLGSRNSSMQNGDLHIEVQHTSPIKKTWVNRLYTVLTILTKSVNITATLLIPYVSEILLGILFSADSGAMLLDRLGSPT
ncbi:hypothetical protein BDQ17DRAFT_1328679 [Cyathus striatus]|nr:hypothetical protein BDQ17DRAFT_1328679 [Cyathus striatus]